MRALGEGHEEGHEERPRGRVQPLRGLTSRQPAPGGPTTLASVAWRGPWTESSSPWTEAATTATGDAITKRPFNRFSRGVLEEPRCQAIYGGFLEGLEEFDNEAFRMSNLESLTTDVQQRLLLEVTAECVSAAAATSAAQSTDVAVHVGILAMEYALSLAFDWGSPHEVYSVTGAGLSVASGRISFVFGFTGPALTVDTACSSSLVALHLAHRRAREAQSSSSSLACGSNALVSRRTFEVIHRAGMLAPDGRCKTLDASANGYTRAEAVQAVLLSSNGDDGGAATAVVLAGGAVNQDGRSASLTAPSGPAQQEMLRLALEDSRLDAGFDVEGIQMHGTGSRLGDPIEVTAIEQNFAFRRNHPLFLSASKCLVGHGEAAAGLNGVIQAVGVATGASAAPFIHLRTLNPYLHNAFESENGVSFVAARQPIPIPCSTTAEEGAGAHGVSAFAFQGTNAHVVLRPVATRGSGTTARKSLDRLWRRKFFWYAHPNHPLLGSFATTLNIHNDLVAEARVDLESPSLSYLHQFKLGGRSILGVSVYLDAVGSLASSMLGDADASGPARQFAMSEIVLGPPRRLESAALVNQFICRLDPNSGGIACRDLGAEEEESLLVRREFACIVAAARPPSAEEGGTVGSSAPSGPSLGSLLRPRSPSITAGPGEDLARESHVDRDVLASVSGLDSTHVRDDDVSLDVLKAECGMSSVYAHFAGEVGSGNPWDHVPSLLTSLCYPASIECFIVGHGVKRRGQEVTVGCTGTEHESLESPLGSSCSWFDGRGAEEAMRTRGVHWSPMIFRSKLVKPIDELGAKIGSAGGNAERTTKSREDYEIVVQKIIEELVGESVGLEESLHEHAVDSFTAEEVATLISREVGLTVTATFVFDYPNVKLMAAHIHGKLGGGEKKKRTPGLGRSLGTRAGGSRGSRRCPGVVAIQSVSAMLPHGSGGASHQRDCISTIPLARWDLNFDSVGAETLPRFGGFIELHKWFDNALFNTSVAESEHIDCRQCSLLTCSFEALMQSGGVDEATGVFVGIQAMPADNPFDCRLGMTGYHGTGTSMSVACGRISYVFGFKGPSLCIDTACSSSLLALHLGRERLDAPSCTIQQALSCGAHCYQSDKGFQVMMGAGMLAPDGRCKTLDASANGYTRAEAVQAALLSREPASSSNGIMAVLGGAVNQDGRSASLTAPSGPAQQEMLHLALEDSRLDAFDVEGIQMHGTGTLLGDPIEIGALSSIFDDYSGTTSGGVLLLSGIKCTAGHAEAAAGLNGVIQAVGVATGASAAPFIHLRTLNPYLHNAFESENGVSFVAARQPIPIPCSTTAEEGAGAHGVSAFAFQGTNAHVVLRPVATRGSGTTARKSLDRLWRRKFFWYAHPNHPLLGSFATTLNIHNDLVAEARVDLESPSLSYLHQFKLGGRSILGVSVYLDAVGSLASSMLGDADASGPARQFAMSKIILGEPKLLMDQWEASSSKRTKQTSFLRCEIHTLLGLANSGFIESTSSPTASFAGHIEKSHSRMWNHHNKNLEVGREISSWGEQAGGARDREHPSTCASVYLPGIENGVSEYALHPLIFENTTLASSATGEKGMLFPVQMAHVSLSAPLKRITCQSAEILNTLGGVSVSMQNTARITVEDIVYMKRREEDIHAGLAPASAETVAAKTRLTPASDEDYNAYTPEDFSDCQSSFQDMCELVSSATVARGHHPLNAPGFAGGADVDIVKRLVFEITGEDEITDDEPLIGAGLDSIASLELRTKLQDMLGVQLPVTLLHDHPCISSLRTLVETTSQTLSSHGGDGQSSLSVQSEHFQAALYLPLLFKTAFVASCTRKEDHFLPFWYPALVYFVAVFVPIFWVFEKLQHYVLYVLDGKYREYQVNLLPIDGAEEDEDAAKEKIVPLTQDDASVSHIYVSACLEFDDIVPEVNLCNSLQIALSHFPSLAGNLVRSGRNMYLKYGGKSDFVRVLAHEYKRRKDMHFKSGMIQEPAARATPGWLQTLNTMNMQVLYAYRCAKPRGHPCMKIYIHQNLRDENPKTLVTVRWNHAVADGSTIHKFLGAWAMADKGRRILSTHAGPSESLSDRQHALLARILMGESQSSLYFPCRSFWSPPYNSVLIRFPEEQIRGHQSKLCDTRISPIDVVSSLLWLAMSSTCYPDDEQVEDDKYFEFASWHPKLSFLVDLRNHLPELQCFTGNLVRCTEPFCPMKDPLSDLKMILGADISSTMRQVGEQRKSLHFSMDYIEEFMRLPGVPLCLQKQQEEWMTTSANGPCLLVNDLTSFRGPFNFGSSSAEVSAESYSSDWSPGDCSLMQRLEDVDLTPFNTNSFWFAHLKNDRNGDIVCALTTFS
ncbi:beta-ketoacyl synthase [Chloropicon primus]|uniref:Beta-ketoacyl synthase n=1 Tax=Chloropicon primus TaxID=1764295 RepID=A0A5B8ME31_9CHLO|nr:beta-ketoacyl synthase [Chloropicon primus]UPQ97730.1 beta-ketoacyl synthase [Chloropicon primus]|eukprot:QDZ18521.1 beta-ketoacyl synthase [Chloropicon primus]